MLFLDVLRERFKLKFKDGHLDDYGYVKRVLNAFSYESGDDNTGYRRINVIRSKYYYDAPTEIVARGLGMQPEDVNFIIEILRESGRLEREDLNKEFDKETNENFNEDPEDAWYREQLVRFG